MRSYEEISNRIMERGDKLIESRRIRAAKIKHTSYAVSGMCAAAIAGIGVWHIASNIKKPDDGFNGSGIVSATDTHTENTSSAEITSVLTTTAEKTAATVKTTAVTTEKQSIVTTSAIPAVASSVQTTSAKITTVPVTSSEKKADETGFSEAPTVTTAADAPTPVTTTCHAVNTDNSGAESVKITTVDPNKSGTVSTSSVHNETAPDISTTAYSGPMGDGGNGSASPTKTVSLQDKFRENPSYITLNGVRYANQSMVAKESIGEYFRRVDVHIEYNRQDIKAVMAAYMIDGIDTEEAVAVQLKDTDEYYLFRNTSYKKNENE